MFSYYVYSLFDAFKIIFGCEYFAARFWDGLSYFGETGAYTHHYFLSEISEDKISDRIKVRVLQIGTEIDELFQVKSGKVFLFIKYGNHLLAQYRNELSAFSHANILVEKMLIT